MPQIVLVALLALGYLFYPGWIKRGKDAPFVPMDAATCGRVMKIAEVNEGDTFYDLGSGDGRLVIAAALSGAKATGVEIDKLRVFYSRLWIWLLRVGDRAKVINADIFDTDLRDASVVSCYLLQKTNDKLEEKFKKELKPGTKVISVAFKFKDFELVKTDPKGTIYGPIYLYKV